MNARIFAAVLGSTLLVSSLAMADPPWRDRGDGWRDHERFEHERFEHERRERDWRAREWRLGQWHRGWHEGRDGWWWVVDGVWYYYPERVAVIPPPPVVVAPPPSVTYPAPPRGNVYYYCGRPRGYYPAIPDCPAGWQIVQDQ